MRNIDIVARVTAVCDIVTGKASLCGSAQTATNSQIMDVTLLLRGIDRGNKPETGQTVYKNAFARFAL